MAGGARQVEFEHLAISHAAALLRFAQRLCGDRSAAEDLVQETLLRGWRSFGQLQADSNPRAWLFRILLNVWHSEGRRRSARPVETQLDRAAHAIQTDLSELAAVNDALARLPEDQREVLLLAVVEGFTCKEMAAMLDIPIGTVMSRLGRARAAMRESAGRKVGMK